MNTFDVSKRCISTYEEFLKDRKKAEDAEHDEKGEADIVKKAMGGEVEGKKGYATLSEAEVIFWEPENRQSTYTFAYPPKPNSVTKVFLDFIINHPGSTRKDFYKSINRPYSPGNNSMFFASIAQADLVELVGDKYYIGGNYGKWTQGLLKKADYKRPSNAQIDLDTKD